MDLKKKTIMDQKERMLAHLPYKAWLDGLAEERLENKKRIYRFNHLSPGQPEEEDRLLRQILGKAGKNVHIEAPFHCDYGYNIEVGENFYANYNLTVLDVGGDARECHARPQRVPVRGGTSGPPGFPQFRVRVRNRYYDRE